MTHGSDSEFINEALAANSSRGHCPLDNTQLTLLKTRLLKKYLFPYALVFLLHLQTTAVLVGTCLWVAQCSWPSLFHTRVLLGMEAQSQLPRPVHTRKGLDFWEEGTGPADNIHRGYLTAQVSWNCRFNSPPRNGEITDNCHLQIPPFAYSTFNFICICTMGI